ncbi:DUF5666 domain-containing protein [Piscinibacter sp.]|uniref:DUF5666 domain-containing protein n=1 Tax=Piscinibacter sp. TaxID=1903157 RepID=UPI0039E33DA1
MRHRLAGLVLALAAAAAGVVAGCGGGVGVGGTGSYVAAPIEGFGSIFVGGIEYDDSAAAVFDDDGAPAARERLQLGMRVAVDGGEIGGSDGAPVARAQRIRILTTIAGPSAAVDAAAGTLEVFGQQVAVDAYTVFDAGLPDGLASVAAGDVLEVHASHDAAAKRYVASRIAPRGGAPGAYRVRGPVQDLDSAARRFRVGAALFAYEGAQPLLAEGAWLSVQARTQGAAGRWMASAVSAGTHALPDAGRVKLRGTITRYRSDADFDLDGQRVDARGAAFDGRPGELAPGRALAVEGRAVDGVLLASRLRLDERGSPQGHLTLHGRIAALDTARQTFSVRGARVSYAGPGVQFERGGVADLADGRAVTVRAVSTGHGPLLEARRISFD